MSNITLLDGISWFKPDKLVRSSLKAEYREADVQQQPRALCISGRNRISAPQTLLYLHRFKNLRMLTLEDNPLSSAPDYRPRTIAHLPHLTYLDHRVISVTAVQAAMDQHQVHL